MTKSLTENPTRETRQFGSYRDGDLSTTKFDGSFIRLDESKKPFRDWLCILVVRNVRTD